MNLADHSLHPRPVIELEGEPIRDQSFVGQLHPGPIFVGNPFLTGQELPGLLEEEEEREFDGEDELPIHRFQLGQIHGQLLGYPHLTLVYS